MVKKRRKANPLAILDAAIEQDDIIQTQFWWRKRQRKDCDHDSDFFDLEVSEQEELWSVNDE